MRALIEIDIELSMGPYLPLVDELFHGQGQGSAAAVQQLLLLPELPYVPVPVPVSASVPAAIVSPGGWRT